MAYLNICEPEVLPLKAINYVGWLGHANVGDEALFLVSKKLFGENKIVPIDVDNVSPCSGITLFGGGTLLPFWTFGLNLKNRYNYVFGVGVRNPRYWGDFDHIFIEHIKRFRFRLLGVRGPLSQNILKKWGIASEVIGDPALILEPACCKKQKERIAINVTTANNEMWGNSQHVIEETIKLCQTLKKQYELTLIPFYHEDVPSVIQISREVGVDVFENWSNPQQTLDFMSSCKVVIGQKLHSIVFSAAAFTPFISLEYRPKCLDFSQTVGYEKYNLKTDQMTAQNVLTKLHYLLEDYDHMRELLIENVGIYRKKIKSFAKRIIEDIEALPENKWLPFGVSDRIRQKILVHPENCLYEYAQKHSFFHVVNQLSLTKQMMHWNTKLFK